jgi:hypothetical protein
VGIKYYRARLFKTMVTGGQNNLCQRGVCVVLNVLQAVSIVGVRIFCVSEFCVVQCVLQAISIVHTPQTDGLLSASNLTSGSDSCTG